MSIYIFLEGIAKKYSGIKFNTKDLLKFVTKKKEPILINLYKKRAHCENNWGEMVYCIKLLYPEVNTKLDIQNKLNSIQNNNKFKCSGGHDNINRYFIDINKRKEIDIENYIKNIKVEQLTDKKIKKIILCGKTIDEFPEIKKINTCPISKELYDIKIRKSDVYIIYENEPIVGISLKADKKCTLTNYSIEKLLNEMNICQSIILKQIRLNVLIDKFGGTGKYNKMQRSEANKLFYCNNKYFDELEKLIINNSNKISKKILEYAFPDMQYTIFGYYGEKIVNLNELSNKLHKKDIKIIRNKNKDSKTSAKIWFSVLFNGEEKYHFEIRFKNDIYKGSAQLLLYKC